MWLGYPPVSEMTVSALQRDVMKVNYMAAQSSAWPAHRLVCGSLDPQPHPVSNVLTYLLPEPCYHLISCPSGGHNCGHSVVSMFYPHLVLHTATLGAFFSHKCKGLGDGSVSKH